METLKNEIKQTLEVWRNKEIWMQRFKKLYHLVGYIALLGMVAISFFLLENVSYIFRYIIGASIVFISLSLFAKRFNKLRSFVGWSIVVCVIIVALPMPTRCNVEDRANPNIVLSIPPASMLPLGAAPYVPHSIFRDCYLPYSIEFWKNPQWSFEFHWVFMQRLDLLLNYEPNHIIIIHLSYPVNLESDGNLVGASQNVFVGKVLEQTGNKVPQIGPRTQYAVEIALNVKGNLSGVITVDMLGGYENGQLVVVENDDPQNFLLTPGSTYLFATRYNEQENWYTLIAHSNARKILSMNEHATIDDLRTIAEKDARVQNLEKVYPSEVLVEADLITGNTRNAFRDLPEEAKATARVRAVEARAAMEKDKAQ